MGGQEGIQIDEGLPVQRCFVDPAVLKLGGGAQRGAARLEVGGQFFFTGCRFGEQAPVADLLDVAGLQMHLDWKAVFQFEQTRCVEHGGGVVLGQGLLGGCKKPDRTVADLFEIFRQAIEVEDEVGLGRDILADSSMMKEDVFFAGTCGGSARPSPRHV